MIDMYTLTIVEEGFLKQIGFSWIAEEASDTHLGTFALNSFQFHFTIEMGEW